MVSSEVKTRRWLPPKVWHAEHRESGSLNFVYASAQSGRLACINVGGRVLIASDALEQIYDAKGNRPEGDALSKVPQ